LRKAFLINDYLLQKNVEQIDVQAGNRS